MFPPRIMIDLVRRDGMSGSLGFRDKMTISDTWDGGVVGTNVAEI